MIESGKTPEEQVIELQERIRELEYELAVTQEELDKTGLAYQSMLNSKTWKMTAPLRKVMDLRKGIGGNTRPIQRNSSELENDQSYQIIRKCKCVQIVRKGSHQAAAVAESFQRFGVDSILLDELPEQCNEDLYVLFQVPQREVLPTAYVAFLSDHELLKTYSGQCYYYLPAEEYSDRLDYYVGRLLLANDRISFDTFYDKCAGFIRFQGARICLGLPESRRRQESFEADNRFGFELFPGLRHRLGWIGCGLSYCFLFRRAKDLQMDQITICEDDTFFPADYEERLSKLEQYLKTRDDWDMFSGLMSDVGDVKVLDVQKEDGENYITIDRMISAVWNIYRPSMFGLLEKWDTRNYDVVHNTIDRYLEQFSLRVITTCPFLVGHKEEHHSSIWENGENTDYTKMIERSSQKIWRLLTIYENQKE